VSGDWDVIVDRQSSYSRPLRLGLACEIEIYARRRLGRISEDADFTLREQTKSRSKQLTTLWFSKAETWRNTESP
jgi:hypothetical protein